MTKLVRIRRSVRLSALFLYAGSILIQATLCRAEESQTANPSSSGRVQADLQVLFEFGVSSDVAVHDRSGIGPGLDVRADDRGGLRHSKAGLEVTRKTLMTSERPARRLSQAITKSAAITIEAWISLRTSSRAAPRGL